MLEEQFTWKLWICFKLYNLFRAVFGGMSIRKDDLESQNHYTTEIQK